MNILSVNLHMFMGHDSTELTLPKTGIVTITGENGAGKSSFVEGISWCGWSKTLRGDVPWRGDAEDPCIAGMRVDGDLTVRRERKGDKTSLSYHRDGAGDVTADADLPASKVQVGLDKLLGSYDLWRRSHVFSSSDAMHFTLATDAERKRLIESFLGTDRFDPALASCRADLKKAVEALADAQRAHGLAQARLEGETRALSDAAAALKAGGLPTPPVVGRHTSPVELDAIITQAGKDIYAIEQKLREADRAGGSDDAVARSAQATLDKLRAATTCPTCTQEIPGDLRLKLKRDVEAAQYAAEVARKRAKVGVADLEALMGQLTADRETARTQRSEHLAASRLEAQAQAAYDQALRGRQLLEAAEKRSTAEIARLKRELVTLEETIDIASGDVAELTVVEKVLGLKGVRANILGTSLSGIEAVANTWLARLRQGVSLRLKPYSELKKGGTEDSIHLEVVGLGRGSYKSTSGGERRRVDVALLLALGEVSAASRGVECGTLWFDEVFDCLDEAGIEAIGEILAELAQRRCVVVITHSKPLIQRLRASRSLHIVRGTIEALG